MAGYSKEFLIECYISRFLNNRFISIEQLVELEEQAIRFYDQVGRDKFRIYASLDAEAIRTFKSK